MNKNKITCIYIYTVYKEIYMNFTRQIIHALGVVCQHVDVTFLYQFNCWMKKEHGCFLTP